MTAASSPAGASISARSLGTRLLPYLLSLPALLVCVGILIPFGTAVWYSLERYNLAFPMTRGLIWYGNYLDFLTDPAGFNTEKTVQNSITRLERLQRESDTGLKPRVLAVSHFYHLPRIKMAFAQAGCR